MLFEHSEDPEISEKYFPNLWFQKMIIRRHRLTLSIFLRFQNLKNGMASQKNTKHCKNKYFLRIPKSSQF